LKGGRSALIVQDLQNDVIIGGSAFADPGAPEHAESQNVVANERRLAEAAREAGMPVIHLWHIVEEGARRERLPPRATVRTAGNSHESGDPANAAASDRHNDGRFRIQITERKSQRHRS
jgi:nicotinamidase-related amidase